MEVVIFLTIFALSFIRNGKNHPDTFEKILIFKLTRITLLKVYEQVPMAYIAFW